MLTLCFNIDYKYFKKICNPNVRFAYGFLFVNVSTSQKLWKTRKVLSCVS